MPQKLTLIKCPAQQEAESGAQPKTRLTEVVSRARKEATAKKIQARVMIAQIKPKLAQL